MSSTCSVTFSLTVCELTEDLIRIRSESDERSSRTHLLLLVLLVLLILDFLNLGLVIITLLLLIVLLNLLLDLLGGDELDRVRDEFRVLLDDILDLLLLEVFELILLHLKDHLSTTTERRVGSVGSDGEGSSSGRFPDVLLIVVVLGDDGNLVGNEVGRVESNTL